MPLPAYKPTRDSTAGRFLGNKVSSIVVGILHLVLTISSIILYKPATDESPGKGKSVSTAVSVLDGLACVIFCVLLFIGLLKNNKCFVKSYLIYSVVFLILAVIGFFVAMFTPSISLGVKGIFLFVLSLLLYLLFLFVVHTYYVLTYCSNEETSNNGVITT